MSTKNCKGEKTLYNPKTKRCIKNTTANRTRLKLEKTSEKKKTGKSTKPREKKTGKSTKPREYGFRSRAQLRTCYGTNRWDCSESLKYTKSVCCLPEKVEGEVSKTRCRNQKIGERIVGKVQTGKRGGKFFTIIEKDSKGVICETKVYVKKS